MIREEQYHDSIRILVKAYLNNTLIPCDCTACAVGNLIADKMGFQDGGPYRWEKNGKYIFTEWSHVFTTSYGSQKVYPEDYQGEAKEQIDSTGYSWEELAQIEFAFETSIERWIEDYDPEGEEYNFDFDFLPEDMQNEAMFAGLIAVIEALGKIHQADEETHKEAVAQFEAVRESR